MIRLICGFCFSAGAYCQVFAQTPLPSLTPQQIFEMRLIAPGSKWSTVVQGVKARYGIVFDRCVPDRNFQTIEFCFARASQPTSPDMTRNPVVADQRFDQLTASVDQGSEPIVVKIGYLFDQNGVEVFNALRKRISTLTHSQGTVTQSKSYMHVGWRLEPDHVVLVSVEHGGKRRTEFQLMTEQFARSGFDRPLDEIFGSRR